VTNRSTSPATLNFTSGCTIVFRVRDRDGHVVAPGAFVCTADAPTLVFAPGETRVARFTWQGDTHDPMTGARPFLPPGTYYLFGALNAVNFSDQSEPGADPVAAHARILIPPIAGFRRAIPQLRRFFRHASRLHGPAPAAER